MRSGPFTLSKIFRTRPKQIETDRLSQKSRRGVPWRDFSTGGFAPIWQEFSPLRSKNSLFSPTEERRQMPFGLLAGNGFPLLLLLRKRARAARLLGPKRPRGGSRPLLPFCG